MAINAELLEQTLACIEANPEKWDQTTWRCETGMCFAGVAAELSGGIWLTSNLEDSDSEYIVAEPADLDADKREVEGRTVVSAEHRARRVLGLTWDQREDLFCPCNTIGDLRRIVAELCEGAA